MPEARRNPAALLALAWHVGGRGPRREGHGGAAVQGPAAAVQPLPAAAGDGVARQGAGPRGQARCTRASRVYGNKGSTDQHAYVQQLRDGMHNFFLTFVRVLRDREGPQPGGRAGRHRRRLPRRASARDAAARSTRAAGPRSRSPSRTSAARSLGMLIALFERAVGLYASLVDINAYHQPGVEAGKKAAALVLELQRKLLAVLVERDGAARDLRGAGGGGGRHGRSRDRVPRARAARGQPGARASRGARDRRRSRRPTPSSAARGLKADGRA